MSSIKLPNGRSLAGEYAQTLSAQLGIMPNMLSGQAEWQPVQTSNQLSNINQLLLGTPELNYDTRVYTPATYRQGNSYSYGKLPPFVTGEIKYPNLPDSRGSGGGGGGGGFDWPMPPGIPSPSQFGLKSSPYGGGTATGNSYGSARPTNYGPGNTKSSSVSSNSYPGSPGSVNGMPLPPSALGPLDPFSMVFGGGDEGPPRRLMTPSGYRTESHNLGAQQGLLSLYENYLAPTMERVQEDTQSSQRGADIADVMRLGPAALAAFKASDPEQANLIDSLTSSAQDELGRGASLDPQLARLQEQSMRGAQAARGMGFGPSDVFNETMGMTQYGEQLRQQRRGYAGQVAGLRQSIYGDPFQRILNRQGPGLGGASNALGQAIGLGGQNGPLGLLNPESQYAQDLHNTNFNALVNQAIGNANNQNALIGAGIGAIGSMAGGAMKFGM